MNTDENTTVDSRPFGFWITAVDRLLRAEFATVFEDEGVTRRDWRMLNLIDGAEASDRPLRAEKLRRLIDLGWIEHTADGRSITDAGRLATQRLANAVQQIRDRVAGAVTPEEFATTTATLEKIAREFGWAEGRSLPGRGHRHKSHHRGHERRHGGRHAEHRHDGLGRHGEERSHGQHGHGRRGHGQHSHGHNDGHHIDGRADRHEDAFDGPRPRERGHRHEGGHWHGHGRGQGRHGASATHIHLHMHS